MICMSPCLPTVEQGTLLRDCRYPASAISSARHPAERPNVMMRFPTGGSMPSTIVGGAMLPHAPQFFTLPETEDKATVARVRDVAARIGAQLAALEPDLWIIFSNDHAEQFFHTVAPAFTI